MLSLLLCALLQPAPAPQEQAWTEVKSNHYQHTLYGPLGERLITHQQKATLWDLRSGERIAQLDAGCKDWQFDASGRLLIGIGTWNDQERSDAGLTLHESRTGRLLLVDGLGAIARYPSTTYEWLGTPSEPRPSIWQSVQDYPMPSGVLRVRQPLANWQKYRLTSGGEFLTRWNKGLLRVVDPKTGEELHSPPYSSTDCAASSPGQGLIALLTQEYELLYWDPRQGVEVRRLALTPALERGAPTPELDRDGETMVLVSYDSVRAYNTQDGSIRWSIGGYTFGSGSWSPDRGSFARSDRQGVVREFHFATGEARDLHTPAPLVTRQCAVLPGSERAVVLVSDGTLRLIDLASGHALAVATEHHRRTSVGFSVTASGAVLSWDETGLTFLRDSKDLTVRAKIALDEEPYPQSHSPSGTSFGLLTRSSKLQMKHFTGQQGPDWSSFSFEDARYCAWSPNGSQLALIYPDRAEVRSTADLQLIQTLDIEADPLGASSPGIANFHGESTVAIAWNGPHPQVGVRIFDIPSGKLLATHNASNPCILGGNVGDIYSDLEAGTLAYSVYSCGYVVGLDDKTWQPRWDIDYGGGSPSALIFQGTPGSDSLYISGMLDDYSRVVDLSTGRVSGPGLLEGCFNLQPTASGKYLIATRNGELTVMQPGTHKELYARSEGEGSSAWIRRGQIIEDAQAGTDSDGRHIRRGDLSRPIDCWSGLAQDPEHEGSLNLATLPTPPSILQGPDRNLQAGVEQVRLGITATDDTGLIAIRVEAPGQEPRLIRVPAGAKGAPLEATLEFVVHGPWPKDIVLRAVSTNGVVSPPWRVHVKP
ncbi:MAG: hypothetical protein ACI9HE_001023 [Planctomycetota bacterium]|jgi:hypothetical protein